MSDITTDFISATKRILAKVGTILTHVEIMERNVQLIREKVVDDAEKPRANSNTKDSNRQIPKILPLNYLESRFCKRKVRSESRKAFRSKILRVFAQKK